MQIMSLTEHCHRLKRLTRIALAKRIMRIADHHCLNSSIGILEAVLQVVYYLLAECHLIRNLNRNNVYFLQFELEVKAACCIQLNDMAGLSA